MNKASDQSLYRCFSSLWRLLLFFQSTDVRQKKTLRGVLPRTDRTDLLPARLTQLASIHLCSLGLQPDLQSSVDLGYCHHLPPVTQHTEPFL